LQLDVFGGEESASQERRCRVFTTFFEDYLLNTAASLIRSCLPSRHGMVGK
jgi:hypothetical protein